MTDYNDGNWHPHKPGPCPIHENSRVSVLFANGHMIDRPTPAYEWKWTDDGTGTIVAFRVVTPYVEPRKPREFWLVVMETGKVVGKEDERAARGVKEAYERGGVDSYIIRVREVIE